MDVKDLMKSAKGLKYSSKRKKDLISEAVKRLGASYLILPLEEINELLEVCLITLYTNKLDYLHTTEEIVDVYFSLDILKIYFNIKDKELKTNFSKNPSIKINKDKITCNKNYIKFISEKMMVLSKSTKVITKYLRGKNTPKNEIIETINNIANVNYSLIEVFNIKKSDLERISLLKYKRLEDKLKDNVPLIKL